MSHFTFYFKTYLQYLSVYSHTNKSFLHRVEENIIQTIRVFFNPVLNSVLNSLLMWTCFFKFIFLGTCCIHFVLLILPHLTTNEWIEWWLSRRCEGVFGTSYWGSVNSVTVKHQKPCQNEGQNMKNIIKEIQVEKILNLYIFHEGIFRNVSFFNVRTVNKTCVHFSKYSSSEGSLSENGFDCQICQFDFSVVLLKAYLCSKEW